MQRHAFSIKVDPGKMGEFRTLLGKLWGQIVLILDENNVRNFSLWNAEHLVFGYYETNDKAVISDSVKNWIADLEIKYKDIFEWISSPVGNMRLMYHDYGYVRTSKELVRHRVFITKLLPGEENEYKKRHDALIEARKGRITEGPNSNFSIWYAGGYIFGYNEIDTTMEHPLSDLERGQMILWENKMLEIMNWVTNDVDWITGEHHDSIKRIAWHDPY